MMVIRKSKTKQVKVQRDQEGKRGKVGGAKELKGTRGIFTGKKFGHAPHCTGKACRWGWGGWKSGSIFGWDGAFVPAAGTLNSSPNRTQSRHDNQNILDEFVAVRYKSTKA
jgi:hypothetical protein